MTDTGEHYLEPLKPVLVMDLVCITVFLMSDTFPLRPDGLTQSADVVHTLLSSA